MALNWRNWCKLCGSIEATTKIEYTSEVEQIIRKILTLPADPLKLCNECLKFLNEINLFTIKSRTVENMFVELLNSEGEEDLNSKYLNDVRIRFGLKELVFDGEAFDTIHEVFDNTEVKEEIDEALGIEEKSLENDDFFQEEDDDENDDGIQDIKPLQSEDSSINDNNLMNVECELYVDIKKKDTESESEDTSDEEYKQEQKKRKKKKRLSADRQEYEKTEEEKLFDFICHICRMEFPKMCFLSKHCRTVHNCLPQVNCVCGKTLGTWNRLLIHKRKHFPQKSHYECQECGLTYLKQSTYETHMKTKHGPEAEKFVCSQCGRCVKDARTLKKHERTHLPDELKLTELCTICNKRFVNKNSLQSHVSSVHTKENVFTCEQCGKCFSSRGNLRSHLTSHIQEKTVPCDKCDMKFKCIASLRTHKRIHNERNYSCSVCGNKYRTRQYLIGHMVVHSDDKKYKCTFCPNEYKRSKDLKCHLNLHTGERPYKCIFCDRTFVNGSNCRKHKLKDHPVELAAWEAVHGKGKAAILNTAS